MMAAVRQRDTGIELAVRRGLHARGFRFRLNDSRLPGRPDIVLPKWRVAVFVHGCYWHAHEECHLHTVPSTRTEFWERKFESNKERDHRVAEAILSSGWRVAIVWECALRSRSALPEGEVLSRLVAWIEDGEAPRLDVRG
jgi:DNA mismatch endonuclease (patch repair protein)